MVGFRGFVPELPVPPTTARRKRKHVTACPRIKVVYMTMNSVWSLRSVLTQLRALLAVAFVSLALQGNASAQANPNQGPGGPILVVTSPSATFSKYYAEILRTEGFNEFAVADVSTVNSASLAAYDVVLLGKVTLTGTQVTALTDWVNAGGNLIAMDPDPALASLLGLTIGGTTLANGYIAVDTSTKVGNGIVGETMQYHGSARFHTLNGASSIATLYTDAFTPTTNSAISLRSVGSNGGQAAAFAYDLATSIVYMRQGNPAWVGQERDGQTPRRSDDLYYGNASSDPQQDWVDRTKISIPQADEQQRLLANLIIEMNSDRKPLPRFWYLPHGYKAAVVMTGDDHAHAGTRARWNEFLAASPANCSLEDWECIRGTSYLFPGTPMTNEELVAFEAQGFEVGLHVNTGCSDYTQESLTQNYTEQLAAYFSEWPGLPPVRTMRHHCIVWSDWASGAKVQLANGIRLDTSYYYWPGPNWVNDTPGHFTGSAMPMRFADLDGTIIDVYQAVSQMTDESGQTYPFTANTLLDRAVGSEEQYGVYTINAHTDSDIIPESTTTVAAAKARGVPVVTARQMLVWLDGRNSSSFGSIAYSNGTLAFTVTAGTGATGLRGMLPRRAGNRALSTIVRGGTDVPFEVQLIKGVEYAVFQAAAGSYSATYLTDTTAPTITSIVPASGATGVSPTANVKVTFSEAMSSGTINLNTIDLRTAGGVVVPATLSYDAATRTATLTPIGSLAMNATYTLTVRGGATDPRVKDLLDNALAATSITTFTTGTVSPYTGWTDAATPTVVAAADNDGVELGVKFRSSVDGFVTGLRFYKSPTNTGTHIGNIWSEDGQNRGNAPFTNESASGWQTVTFASPIPIVANTTYIASYYAPNGQYSVDGGYFGTGHTSGPLYFPSSSEAGGNGVFAYASSSTFPNGSFNSSNYWVDVIFSVSAGGDTTAPAVSITSPTSSTTYTSPGASLVLSGTASDASGISQVTWSNNRGGSGTATGTTSWTTSPIGLHLGTNVLTVTARDSAGNLGITTLTVTFNGDLTPPTITARTPAPGQSGVSAFAKVLVTFDEAVNPNTLSTSTLELRTAGNALVPASVSYNATTLTATLTPTQPLNPSSTYTVNVKGGAVAPQVKDLAGNALAATSTWTFSTSSSICPCTIWDSAAAPVNASDPDDQPVELGVKFRSDVSGSLTGIRFYKSLQNTGPHTARLWSATGQIIATATFDNETASGWQQANFDQPVAITANTTYIASYHAPNGRYAADALYFSNSSTDRAMLHALQNGFDGDNGVYRYGPAGTFPNQSWNASNYWVDVVFSTEGVVDTVPPVVSARSPVAGATNVTLASPITVTFNEPMDPATITTSTIELRNASNAVVAATVNYNAATRVATLSPSVPLTATSTYTMTVRGGATDPRVKDAAGNALANNDVWTFTTGTSAGPCAINAITAENCLIGNLPSEWDITGAGDPTIQGFATQISVNRGSTIQFKIDTNATNYRLDIYRMGYYGGRGARKIRTINPSVSLPQSQPDCLEQESSGLIDCGNWAVSASWQVPADAVSGIYFAKVIRADTGGASHIVFIVRDDSSTSDVVFQTSDTTWQAYNSWGGNSLYTGSPGTNPGRAYKVSYNRPFNTREVDNGQDWVFNSEYPMVRWLEANGYDVTYISGVDSDRTGTLLLNHKVFLSVGHDEYWSAQQRTNVEAARAAGVNLAFFSGNEVFWKTRWESSIDNSNTPYRTLVSYKETHAGGKIDPTATWTGTWRDGRFSSDGGKPENSLTGTLFRVNSGTRSIEVPASFGKMRFWRNTAIATANQTTVLPLGTLGYEWDEAPDDDSSPAGLVRLSSTVASGVDVLQDLGSTYNTGSARHALTLYRHSSGALVFGAGTVQWAWGLDEVHDRAGTPSDLNMRQATVNLLADMGAQAHTLEGDLIPAEASTDTAGPTVSISSPTAGATAAANSALIISGTATDAGGEVGAVQVSVDGGTTWRTATVARTGVGTATWSFSWTPTVQGSATIIARAADDSANIGANSVGVTVSIGAPGTVSCPCSLFLPTDGPSDPAENDTNPVVTGVKFRSTVAGNISAIRFYKDPQATGTHTALLWAATGGAPLASVPFTSETASGWQQVELPTPVAIQANVTYIVAYHSTNGRYAATNNYFFDNSQTNGPLTAPATGDIAGGNGVFKYGSASAFPDETFQGANYWVDVVFNATGGGGSGGDSNPPALAFTAPTTLATYAAPSAPLALSGTASDDVGVTQISWANNRGGSGNATGTTSWSISTIPLQNGSNVITVTARDAAGNVATKVLTVEYAAPADTTLPVVTITSPTAAGAHSTTTGTLNIGGTASDASGITQVLWSNSLTGASGTATGTTSWSVNGIALVVGLNTITISAVDGAGNVGAATLAVTYSLAPDTVVPTIAIQSPASGGTISTSNSTVTLSGIASDNVGVTQVTWSSSRNISGTATGTTSWNTGPIPIAGGNLQQTITVRARDAAGNIRTASLTVRGTGAADGSNPTVSITDPTTASSLTTTNSTITLGGNANDNNRLVSVTWSNNRGGSGTATLASNAPPSTTWSAPNIALQPGVNSITVTATDLQGLTATDSISVTYVAPTAGLVAAWAFNEGTGSNAMDASGNDNLGAITNGTWVTGGKFGAALQFNGTSSRVSVPNKSSLNLTNGMTLMAWVYPTSSQSGNRTILRRQSGGYWLYAGRTSNPLRPGGGASFVGGLLSRSANSGSTQLQLNTWNHVAVTYNGSTITLYINGASVATTSQTGNISSGSSSLYIGGTPTSEFFQGRIDEVRIYNRGMTQAEISGISNIPIAP